MPSSNPTPRPTRSPISSRPTSSGGDVNGGDSNGGDSNGGDSNGDGSSVGAAEKKGEDDKDDMMLPIIVIAGGGFFLCAVMTCFVMRKKKKNPSVPARAANKGKGKTAPEITQYESGPPSRAQVGSTPVRATAAPGFGRAIANPMFQAPRMAAAPAFTPTYHPAYSASNEFDA